jgi:hypothetical protein
MKLILILALLFGMVGCSKKEEPSKPQEEEKEETKEESRPIKTIVLNEFGHMDSELGIYELIFDGELRFKVDDDYLMNILAFEYEEPLFSNGEIGTVHIEGDFVYSHNNVYLTHLNKIEGNFFYMGEGGDDFFQLNIVDNKITYSMYSTGQAVLKIYKIWRFIPNEEFGDC